MLTYPGVMWSSLAHNLTSNGYSAISLAGMTLPLGRMNCLSDSQLKRWQGSAMVPTPEVVPLSATVVAIIPLRMPCCSSSSLTPMMYCQLVRRCSILACHLSAFLFQVMIRMVGEMSTVLLQLTCHLLLLGTTGGSACSCSSTWHGGGAKQE